MANKRGWISVLLGALVILLFSSCVNYAKEVQKALERSFRQDMRGYTFRGTPVGNFGVGTMYLNEIENPKTPVEQHWLIGLPDTWFAATVTQEEKNALMKRIIADGTMGSVKLEEDISKKLGLDACVPVLQDLLFLGGTVSLEKGVKVTLNASEAVNHRMNWTEFQTAVGNGKIDKGVADHVHKGDFLIAADDVVLIGYKATISVDAKINPELNAKLTSAVGRVLGKDTQLKIKFDSSHKGTFEAEAVNPVVVAILFKAPPPTQMSGTKTMGLVSQWRTVKIGVRTLKPLEELLSRR
jgi:hypothetical protein